MSNIATFARLGAKPEIRSTKNGKAVVTLRLALAEERIKKDNDWINGPTKWVNATVWERLAENAAESLNTGDQIYIVGDLFPETWTDTDGNQRVSDVIKNVRVLAVDLHWQTLTSTRNPKAGKVDYPWNNPEAAPTVDQEGMPLDEEPPEEI